MAGVSQDRTGLDFANFLPDPDIAIEKYVKTNIVTTYEDADDPNGSVASTSSLVEFKITLTNTGNVALTSIAMADSIVHNPGGIEILDYNDPALNVWVDLNRNGVQDAGEDWISLDGDGDMILESVVLAVDDDPGTTEIEDQLDIYYSLDSLLGQHENTASVTAVAALGGATTGPVSDDANYYVLEEDCVGVGTPGFWSNNGFAFWNGLSVEDGDAEQGKHAGQPGFAENDLLIQGNTNGTVDSNGDGVVDGNDKGLLVGDYNQNGITDIGEDTIFISYDDAVSLINASNRQVNGGQADGVWMVGRDVVATWLNFLANNPNGGDPGCIGQVDDDGTIDPREAIDAAIDWLQQFASNKNADDTMVPNDSNTNTNFHTATNQAIFEFDSKIATKSASWKSSETPGDDLALSGSQIHSALDEYNNTGIIDGVEYCCDRDNPIAMDAVAQVDQYQSMESLLLSSGWAPLPQDQTQDLMYSNAVVAI
ncbi:hypothetical protein [Erythrobacter mangrovi]|uniref:DUF11 domain-containing protein n=1 Tax=Erythrobacter mangrovi TaxID=2739433 RepID=A0A7D4CNQ3_9SPHN|nr:hypothetical protein [Erythrobacter mangrovi]QKG72228.1 hypothetical protein HQR01_13105 [Erythrobacter mangrovi]